MSTFETKPNPDQPDRCPSIDPHDCLQCTRLIHDDDQCHSGGIAWKKGTPRHLTEGESARLEVKAAVEEWFSDVSLDDLFATKGWSQ